MLHGCSIRGEWINDISRPINMKGVQWTTTIVGQILTIAVRPAKVNPPSRLGQFLLDLSENSIEHWPYTPKVCMWSKKLMAWKNLPPQWDPCGRTDAQTDGATDSQTDGGLGWWQYPRGPKGLKNINLEHRWGILSWRSIRPNKSTLIFDTQEYRGGYPHPRGHPIRLANMCVF